MQKIVIQRHPAGKEKESPHYRKKRNPLKEKCARNPVLSGRAWKQKVYAVRYERNIRIEKDLKYNEKYNISIEKKYNELREVKCRDEKEVKKQDMCYQTKVRSNN